MSSIFSKMEKATGLGLSGIKLECLIFWLNILAGYIVEVEF